MGVIPTSAPWVLCLGMMGLGCTSSPGSDERDASRVEPARAPAPDPLAPDDEDDAFGGEPIEVAAEDGEADAAPDLETLAGCSGSPASFAISDGAAIGGPLVGFGAQFNAYLYHPSGRFAQSKVDELAGLLNKLHPHHVRIFFDSRAFRDPTNKSSFSRTVALAQNAGATVNVTYWHGPYKGKRGTAEFDAGHSAIKYVTIQNEPNRTKFNNHKEDLVQLYKTFHAAAQVRGIRGKFALIPEMTRGYPGTKSYFKDWLKVIGAGAGGIIDGYAFHIYWDHDAQDSFRDRRLAELKEGVKALPAAQRKPMYVTEFGTRGEPDTNKAVEAWPGWQKKGCTAGRKGCRRIMDTTVAGANNAFFQIAAARAGFRAFVLWDAYWTMYDKADLRWSMIGRPSEGLRPKPTYYVQKLLSHVVGRGWVPVSVSDPRRQHLRSTAFKGDGHLTVLGVNKSSCATTFRYSGLPRRKVYELVWNEDGSGTICSRGLRTPVGGKLTVAARARSLVALSTRPSGLSVPRCGAGITTVPPGTCGDGDCTEGEDDVNCGEDCGCGADACGTVAPWGCYCDATCAADGDCCADVGVCQ